MSTSAMTTPQDTNTTDNDDRSMMTEYEHLLLHQRTLYKHILGKQNNNNDDGGGNHNDELQVDTARLIANYASRTGAATINSKNKNSHHHTTSSTNAKESKNGQNASLNPALLLGHQIQREQDFHQDRHVHQAQNQINSSERQQKQRENSSPSSALVLEKMSFGMLCSLSAIQDHQIAKNEHNTMSTTNGSHHKLEEEEEEQEEDDAADGFFEDYQSCIRTNANSFLTLPLHVDDDDDDDDDNNQDSHVEENQTRRRRKQESQQQNQQQNGSQYPSNNVSNTTIVQNPYNRTSNSTISSRNASWQQPSSYQQSKMPNAHSSMANTTASSSPQKKNAFCTAREFKQTHDTDKNSNNKNSRTSNAHHQTHHQSKEIDNSWNNVPNYNNGIGGRVEIISPPNSTSYNNTNNGGPYSNQNNNYYQQHPQQQDEEEEEDGLMAKMNPHRPALSAGLKRKFQLPKPRTANTNSSSSSSNRGGGGGGGGGGQQKKDTQNENNDEDDDLPEELKGLDKELITKIENEILDDKQPVTFSDIAGLQDAKQTVQELVCWPMKRPDLFTGLRRGPNGLLLFGPPGTGKTLIGKAIAHESGATFFSISSSSLTSKWIGEGEKLVRTLFRVAVYREPAVVFLDEIDSLLTQRKADENEASRRIKTEFLVQLDGTGTSGTGRVLAIGATNRPHELDDAARRRFVKRLYIPLPEQSDRKILLQTLLEKNNHNLTERELHKLSSSNTDGFSGADLKALCTDAALGPIRQLGTMALEVNAKDVPPISYRHFRHALKGMRPSVAKEDLDVYVEWNQTYGSKSIAGDKDDDELSDEEESEEDQEMGEQ